VRIGRVADIYFDKERYQAVAVLSIERHYDTLPVDTSASILTSGLLGEQYVALEPGGSDEYLKDGGRITLTQSALVLEKLISQFLYNMAANPEEKK
jgi:phospholipid/cholesterol/gamma-HCH transport system substrate-binding protein